MSFTSPYMNTAMDAWFEKIKSGKSKEVPGKPINYEGETLEAGESIELGPLAANLTPNNMTVDEIMQTQRILAQGGFDLGPTGVDGVWGPKTQAAYDASGQQGFSTEQGEFVNDLHYHSSPNVPNQGFSTEVQGTPQTTYTNEPEYNAVVGQPAKQKLNLGGLLGNILKGIFANSQPQQQWKQQDGQWVQSQGASGQFDMPLLQGLLGAINNRGKNRQ
jgi:hypothetical protein